MLILKFPEIPFEKSRSRRPKRLVRNLCRIFDFQAEAAKRRRPQVPPRPEPA
jgi:hypothetical protein